MARKHPVSQQVEVEPKQPMANALAPEVSAGPDRLASLSPGREPTGLVVKGVVVRRTRKMVGNEEQREVITYTLGPRYVTFEHWEPTRFYQLGEVVEVEVTPSVWNGRVTFLVPRAEEEF